MRFSLEWLRDHVEIDLDAKELAGRLTAAGFAVEGMEETGSDVALEVEVTTNRPDCMCHRGLAREIAALTGKPLRGVDARVVESARPAREVADVKIADPDLCSRYVARVIQGARAGPSPPWVERRLRSIGLVPKSNVVDASNYVLWDLGQPLHTFDLRRLEGGRIVVRRARAGERLVTVADGLEHPLDESMLVIADAARPVAIAGVMGGLESGISDDTRDILIESAWFDPVSVRRTSRALDMHTDASHRFERGVDPDITLLAADKLCRVILELAGGEALAGPIDVVARAHPKRRAPLRRSRLAEVLGMRVGDEQVERILSALEIAVDRTPEGWQAILPSHRSDLAVEEDLIEEVARSIGYDAIPSTLPTATLLPAEKLRAEGAEALAREALRRAGYCETISYAMVGRAEDELFAPEGAEPPLAIDNPLSERWEVMRRTILPGLVQAAQHNLRHGQRDAALCEIGTIFHRASVEASAKEAEAGLPREERVAGLLGFGRAGTIRWNLPRREFDLYDLTGAIEALASGYQTAPVSIVAASRPFLHPRMSFAALLGGEVIGFGGILHPDVCVQLELPTKCAVAQISLTTLGTLPASPRRFRSLSRFPAVSRDISAIVSEEVAYAEVERAVRDALSGTQARWLLTDRYVGTPLPGGRVSLTFSLTIEPEDRTWTMEEIDDLTGRVMRALERKVGAEIRA